MYWEKEIETMAPLSPTTQFWLVPTWTSRRSSEVKLIAVDQVWPPSDE